MLDFLTNFLQSFKEKTWLKLLLEKKLLKELKIEKDDFEITRDEEDAIVVGGRIVDDVLAKYVIGMDDESLITFLHMMRNLGMEEALQEFGVQDGDTVKIADVEFEYFE